MPEKSLCSKSRVVISVCEMKWNEGAHGRTSFMELLNVKSGPNVIAGVKCKVQNNKKIQETQTSVTSTMKAEQER